jgi:hypothetical protein
MRNISEKVVEKIKMHVLYSSTFFGNHAIYEIMWKKYCRALEPTEDNVYHMAHTHGVLDI